MHYLKKRQKELKFLHIGLKIVEKGTILPLTTNKKIILLTSLNQKWFSILYMNQNNVDWSLVEIILCKYSAHNHIVTNFSLCSWSLSYSSDLV